MCPTRMVKIQVTAGYSIMTSAMFHFRVHCELVMADISNVEFDTISIFFTENIDILIFFDISKLKSI